ncbi:hypothetical protein JCM8115_006748 [Rhodotorula mucilaginosa]|uniref:Gfd2/YDR514C-like C-terminal domain-containing protein n=1 Tax=Rhodotorula mucilaginosa TaxID=5537 RepID=A0A9P6W370_RHOMI|nr:hypothetical protein C6P46_004101 [Rhodotorula mucilaginosa]TKA56374.1 hypothetical protein B0A53_01944 [Rhodotorula sp. CCFEE 5036]
MAQGEPRDEQELPEVFVQLKYVLFSWPNTPLLKRDGLARDWFKSHSTMTTFVDALGGFPLTVYEATLPGLARELFLSQQQVDVLIADLSNLMGPSRARASFKETAFRKRSELVKGTPSGAGQGIRTHVFHSQEELERRFGELKDEDDWHATTAHWRELKRAQSAWTFCRDRVVRGEIGEPHYVAVDVETWERDHDLITEVGIACLRFAPNGGSQFTTKHYVVAENADKRNGRYCPDARDHFQFGQSTVLPREHLVAELSTILTPPTATGPSVLLLHDHRGDVNSLTALGLDLNRFERNPLMPEPPHAPDYAERGSFLLDTQRLYSGWSRRKRQVRLEDACKSLNVALPGGDSLAYHNSGNDAWATLAVFVKLMDAPIGETADDSKPAGWTR